MAGLVSEHALFRAGGAFSFLAADFLDARPFLLHVALPHPLDLVEQQSPRQKAVHGLVPRRLAFHTQARWPMQQHDAGGTLVHLLSACAAGADERFLDIGFVHAQGIHP